MNKNGGGGEKYEARKYVSLLAFRTVCRLVEVFNVRKLWSFYFSYLEDMWCVV